MCLLCILWPEFRRPEDCSVCHWRSSIQELRLSLDLTESYNFLWQWSIRLGEDMKRPVWLVEVKQAGRYWCELSRWPRESSRDRPARRAARH